MINMERNKIINPFNIVLLKNKSSFLINLATDHLRVRLQFLLTVLEAYNKIIFTMGRSRINKNRKGKEKKKKN